MPLHLKIESSDPQAVDMLSVPTAVFVRLRLTFEVPSDQMTLKANHISSLTYKTEIRDLNAATWWPSAYGSGTADEQIKRRMLDGEISLPSDLVPSFRLFKFGIHYHVAIFPSQTVAFVPSDNVKAPLLMEDVEIVSAYGGGPRPISYAPLDYGQSSSGARNADLTGQGFV